MTKSFRSRGETVRAVAGVDLAVSPGEVVAVLGPNGAGKTTTLDMVLGLTEPTTGRITSFGSSPRRAVHEGRVSAVLQTGGLLRDLTARETVRYVASTFARHEPVEAVLERAGLADKANRRVSKLSGGEQQRLRFALLDQRIEHASDQTAGDDGQQIKQRVIDRIGDQQHEQPAVRRHQLAAEIHRQGTGQGAASDARRDHPQVGRPQRRIGRDRRQQVLRQVPVQHDRPGPGIVRRPETTVAQRGQDAFARRFQRMRVGDGRDQAARVLDRHVDVGGHPVVAHQPVGQDAERPDFRHQRRAIRLVPDRAQHGRAHAAARELGGGVQRDAAGDVGDAAGHVVAGLHVTRRAADHVPQDRADAEHVGAGRISQGAASGASCARSRP